MNSENLNLFVIGINHKSSTISEREIFQINKNEVSSSLKYFKLRKEVEGVVIISTCNRLEFYLVLNQNIDPFTIIKDFYVDKNQIDAERSKKIFYIHQKSDVANHLFRVISGLESVVLGEYQIQGQIKDAYSVACSEKTADKILHKLFHAAFRAGKHIRNHTKIGAGKQSLSGIAFQIISEEINKDDTITIIGVNENTKIIVEKLYLTGYTNLNFVNRTLYKAVELAEKYNGTAYSLNRFDKPLIKSKCLFTCTGSQEFIINADELNKIYAEKNCPALIIDMAIPRDVDTKEINEAIKVFNLEGLKSYLQDQRLNTSENLSLAEKIIEDEANIFEVWSEAQKDDVFAPFAEKIELMRQQLIDETNTQLSKKEIQMLEKFSRSLVHRLKASVNQALRTNGDQKKAS
ncbi:MAG: glutamyl-tRNA reductase [Ignavibacteriaceae bacterium]|nr:glutamyl-tRNA reductase [Ignavibacteriaceae bacterium]